MSEGMSEEARCQVEERREAVKDRACGLFVSPERLRARAQARLAENYLGAFEGDSGVALAQLEAAKAIEAYPGLPWVIERGKIMLGQLVAYCNPETGNWDLTSDVVEVSGLDILDVAKLMVDETLSAVEGHLSTKRAEFDELEKVRQQLARALRSTP